VIGRYTLGVLAALGAGAANNLGQLAQKIAVNRLPEPDATGGRLRSGLFVRLLASRLWLAGLAVVLLVGTPLNVVAALWLGPALLPGLMSLGLVVLAIGAVTVAGERLGPVDLVGIALVMAGIVLTGLSRLQVDVVPSDIHEPTLITRLTAFTLCTVALAFALLAIATRVHGARGPLRALAAGLFFSSSNQWLAELMHAFNNWLMGGPLREDLGLAVVALALIAACSLLGTIIIQHAYQVGDASRLVPIQMVPAQIVPLLAFLIVFRSPVPSASALPFAAAGAALILGGAGLLAGRQASAGTPKVGSKAVAARRAAGARAHGRA
jgi:drug/metabolite transporter (DMT)-like permease